MLLKQAINDNLTQLLKTADIRNIERFASQISIEIADDCKILATSDAYELNEKNATRIVVWLRDNYVFRIVDSFESALLDNFNNLDTIEINSLKVFKRYTDKYTSENRRNAAISAVLVFRNIGDSIIEKYNIENEVKGEISNKSKR